MTEVLQCLAVRTGLWWGEVVIRDRGLDREGAALARALAEQNGVAFSPEELDTI